jgi:outer membrane protein assembly factor BamB
MKTTRSFLLGLLSAASLLPLRAADWPHYRGPTLDGRSAEQWPLPAWPADGLRRAWQAKTETGFSSFTIAGGRAYTVVAAQIDGVKREVCVALDARTGQEIWRTPFGVARYDGGGDSGTPDNKGGDGPRSTPVVSDGRVYLFGGAMNLVCLEASTGQSVWAKGILQDFGGRNIRWQSAASPVVDGELVFVAGGGPGQSLLAFNKKTGALVWKTQDDGATHATPVVADILGVRQVIFLTQRGLVALAPKDGAVLWRHEHPFRTATGASPVVSGDIVYCSSGYGVGATAVKLSKAGGEFQATLLWRKPNQLMNHWSTPVAKDGFIYGLFGHAAYGKAPLACVELATGEQKWSQPGFGPGGVILVDNQLVVLADDGEVVVVKAAPAAYAETGRFQAVAGKCWSTPAFSDGKIYLRSTTEGVCYTAAAK